MVTQNSCSLMKEASWLNKRVQDDDNQFFLIAAQIKCGIWYEVCPVGAHYMHGKVERKIQQIKKSMVK